MSRLVRRIFEEAGHVVRLSVARDVTDQKRTEHRLSAHAAEMRSLSLRDELTGLANRRGFFEGAHAVLTDAARSGASAGLFYIDVNGMKPVNDDLGHEEGDRLLIDVATILRATFRHGDVVGRMGGDEFAVLALCGAAVLDTLVGRLNGFVTAFNSEQTRRYKVSLSIGVVDVPPSVEPDLDALLAEADVRMYDEKRSGRIVR